MMLIAKNVKGYLETVYIGTIEHTWTDSHAHYYTWIQEDGQELAVKYVHSDDSVWVLIGEDWEFDFDADDIEEYLEVNS